jgi:membrane protein DedA with SNARE-associated domain
VVPREPRALVFLTAGARAVPVSTFLQYDILGGALWVPAMLIVGHGFGTQIGDLDHAVGWLNRSAGWATGIGALLLVIWLSWGREESKL